MRMTTRVSFGMTWHICQIVVNCFFLVVSAYVLNQYRGYWLLSNALHFAISMSRETKKCTVFLDPNGRGF